MLGKYNIRSCLVNFPVIYFSVTNYSPKAFYFHYSKNYKLEGTKSLSKWILFTNIGMLDYCDLVPVVCRLSFVAVVVRIMPSITDARILEKWYTIWINDPLFSRLQFWRMIWLDLYLRVTGTQDIHSLRRHASHQRWLLAGVQRENYKLKLKCSNKRLACIHPLTAFQYCAHYIWNACQGKYSDI